MHDTRNPDIQYDLDSLHAGWQKMTELPGFSGPLFERLLFLHGYEYSANVYLFTGDELTLVDSGNDYTAFVDLERRGHKLTDIKRIILTHGHQDHSMGMMELMRSLPQGSSFELVMHEAGPREFKELAKEVGLPLTLVKGGETVKFAGAEWQVIHTPGHTVDGICLYDPATRTLFTGDTVMPYAMGEPDRAAGGVLDYYIDSVRELLKLDIANVLPGHGLPVAADGRTVTEQTYESLMLKFLGIDAEKKLKWIDGAMQLAERGRLEEALFCADRQLKLDATMQRAWQLKIVLLNDLGRFLDSLNALKEMESAPQAGPSQAGASQPGPQPGASQTKLSQAGRSLFMHVARGYAYMGLNQIEAAISNFDDALKIDPNSRDAQTYKGMALFMSGRHDEAMDIEAFKNEFMNRFKDQMEQRGAKKQ